MGETPSIWTKVSYDVVPATEPVEANAATEGASLEGWRQYWRWRRHVLDAVGAVGWTYLILKVFVADIDTDIVGSFAKYRFFAFAAIALLLALLLKKKWAIIGGFAYVAFFPVVVLAWKVPKALGRTRSPVVFLAAVNVLTVVFGNIKRTIVSAVLVAFSALVISISHSSVLLWVAGVVMAGMIVRTLWRTIVLSLRPTLFVRMQQGAIRKIVDSQALGKMISPGDDLRSAAVEKFDQAQQTTFLTNLGNGVMAHRVLGYWAYQLERYRRSAAPLFFNAASYAWLIIKCIVGLAFLNLALYHASRSAFTYHMRPGFLVELRYVIAGLYGSEIGALQAKSGLADVLSIATFLVGLAFLGSLVLSSVVAYRTQRNESEIRETVAELDREGRRLDERLRAEYDVSVEEAIQRLEDLKFGLMGVITYLSTRIPVDFGRGDPGGSPR